MNFSEPERTIVNLGILGQINKNVKISTYGNYLTLQEPIPIYTPIVRWSYGDKKGKTVSRIKEIVDQAKALLDSGKLDAQTVLQLEEGLRGAIGGLENLQYTYFTNPKTSAQIRLIRDKVLGVLRERGYVMEAVAPRNGPSVPVAQSSPGPPVASVASVSPEVRVPAALPRTAPRPGLGPNTISASEEEESLAAEPDTSDSYSSSSDEAATETLGEAGLFGDEQDF